MKPMVLIIVSLVALQAVVNLISDWSKDEVHYGGEDLDEEEIARIKAQVGTNSVNATDATSQNTSVKD